MLQTILSTAKNSKPTLENSVHYIAHTFSFLATGKDTDNAYSLIHCYFRKGFTPPPHFHQLEDESFYILEGKMEFQIGEKKFTASAGEFVVAPKGIPHSFNLISETAKALLVISPAGFETLFREFGEPAITLELPPAPETLPKQLFAQIHQRCIELGNVWMPQM
jgi:quercetin dioxygenase-like cupin family protein